MTDYTKLVKALRCLELRLSCNECEYGVWSESGEAWSCDFERRDADAADAIEALQAELAGSKDAIRILKHNLERMKENRMNQIEKEMARLKREMQDENISKFADGEWWKEAQE